MLLSCRGSSHTRNTSCRCIARWWRSTIASRSACSCLRSMRLVARRLDAAAERQRHAGIVHADRLRCVSRRAPAAYTGAHAEHAGVRVALPGAAGTAGRRARASHVRRPRPVRRRGVRGADRRRAPVHEGRRRRRARRSSAPAASRLRIRDATARPSRSATGRRPNRRSTPRAPWNPGHAWRWRRRCAPRPSRPSVEGAAQRGRRAQRPPRPTPAGRHPRHRRLAPPRAAADRCATPATPVSPRATARPPPADRHATASPWPTSST